MGEAHASHPLCRKKRARFLSVFMKEATEVLKGGEGKDWAPPGSLNGVRGRGGSCLSLLAYLPAFDPETRAKLFGMKCILS